MPRDATQSMARRWGLSLGTSVNVPEGMLEGHAVLMERGTAVGGGGTVTSYQSDLSPSFERRSLPLTSTDLLVPVRRIIDTRPPMSPRSLRSSTLTPVSVPRP